MLRWCLVCVTCNSNSFHSLIFKLSIIIVHNSPTLKKMGLYWVGLSVIPSVQLSLSAQYLENRLTEFHQILYIQSYWQDLAWDCYTSFLTYWVMALDLHQNFVSPQSWKQIDRILPNCIYAFILTRFILGLLHVIFCTFVLKLWPLIYAKISFPLTILRAKWQNFTKFYICIHIDKI